LTHRDFVARAGSPLTAPIWSEALDTECDVLIAGGGIAGLTAGVTAARLGRKTLVLTGDVPGGQLISIEKIDGYPGFPEGVPGYDLCPMLQEQAAAAGVEFTMTGVDRLDSLDGKWRVASGEGDILARAVIVATGSSLKKLGVPGEERLTGNGVSHCASCDAPLLRDRIVAVVGGGDSAMQEALTLAEFAAKVIIFHRGAALTGQACYRDRVTAHQKLDIRFNTLVTEILGETKVTGLRTRKTHQDADSDLEVAAIFAYVGLQPNAALLQDHLNLDGAGRIPADGWMRSELVGVCAAGTVRSQSPCRAVSAAGDGAGAAVAVDRYLTDGSWRKA
jgi:thioredoxin reductase (NADPH)